MISQQASIVDEIDDDDDSLSDTSDISLPEEEPLPPLFALYMQYFSVGLVQGTIPATMFGLFMGYLKVDSHVFTTAGQVVALPWSFKIVFAMLSDCVPIAGYRRIPYMVIGWTICAVALGALANTHIPNPGDKDQAGPLVAKMTIAVVGYMIADVAADGLTVQIAQKESMDKRGSVQTSVYIVRTIGSIVASIFVGIGMNGRQYKGTFDFSLSFSQVCACVAVPAMIMAPISWIYVPENRAPKPDSMKVYTRKCWDMMKSKAFFYIVIYNIGHGMIGSISTTAAAHTSVTWAGVQNLQTQLFSVVGQILFAAGLVLVKMRMLNYSWRKTIAATTLFLGAADSVPTFFTIYNVLRNQYFFLGEDLVEMVPAAVRFMVTTFVVVEMAPKGQEGITYGMLTTLHNIGGPISRGISNFIFGTFFEGLSDISNYEKDTDAFRNEVAASYGLSYGCGLVGLAFLFFLPDQRYETKQRLDTWPEKDSYAKATLLIIVIAWLYALTSNILVMVPETSCMRWLGGSGCP